MSSLPDWIRCYPDYHCDQSAVVHMPFACRPVAWWAQRTGTRSAETVAVAAFAPPIESGRSRPPSAALHSRQLPPRPGRTNLEFLRLYFKHREPSSMKFDAVYIYTSFPKSQSSLSCYQKKLVKNQWDNFPTPFLWDFQKKNSKILTWRSGIYGVVAGRDSRLFGRRRRLQSEEVSRITPFRARTRNVQWGEVV